MFVETITSSRDEWERFNERLRMLDDPPAALVASVVWEAGDGLVTALNVWDSPEAVGDFFIERVQSAIQASGAPAATPERHGEPLALYVRGMPARP